MVWLLLTLAIVTEVLATSLLGFTERFTAPGPTAGVLLLYGCSFFLLSRVVERVELGVAYALWAGLGTAAVAGVGVVFLGEPLSLAKVLGVALIVAGIVVLNLTGARAEPRGPR